MDGREKLLFISGRNFSSEHFGFRKSTEAFSNSLHRMNTLTSLWFYNDYFYSTLFVITKNLEINSILLQIYKLKNRSDNLNNLLNKFKIHYLVQIFLYIIKKMFMRISILRLYHFVMQCLNISITNVNLCTSWS